MTSETTLPEMQSEYVQVGALQMYCETRGRGRPLLLLHAGLATIETSFEKSRPVLAKRWTTMAVEQQGHGHTADIDRPLAYEQMVGDTAALLREKKIANADVFGWSDGGIVALGLAARHPDLVRKVAIIGAGYNTDAWKPDVKQRQAALKPDNGHTLPFRNAYRNVAPKPEDWPLLIEKVKTMWAGFKGWPDVEMRSLKAPLMVMLGDDDFIRPEHALELLRMVPSGRLAILPGSDHSAPVTHSDWVTSMLIDFFDAPFESSPITATPPDKTVTNDSIAIARAAYDAYVSKDRAAIEALIADDFHFSSPLDNRIDRTTYFDRCWPNSKTTEVFEFIHLVQHGEQVLVTYEARGAGGHRFRNTEIVTVRGSQIVEVEVYFGWDLPHKAAVGGFVANSN